MSRHRLVLTALAASCIPVLGCQQPHTTVSLDDSSPRPQVQGGGVALAARGEANSPEAIGLPDHLSVMSFNMEHKDRPAEVAVMAEHLRSDMSETPDFILLQEVVFGRRAKGEDNTAAVLANELNYYSRGTQRSSDHEGIAIVSRYPFLYYASRELKHQTSRVLLGFNRVSVMGEFKVPELGRVRVVNVHFTNWDFDARVRRDQLEETLQWVASRQAEVPADLIILGGDFNIESTCNDLDAVHNTQLTGGIEYHSYNDPNSNTRGGKRIDFIFIATPTSPDKLAYERERTLWADGLKFTGSRGRFHPSDHLPVLQEYRIAGTSAAAVHTAAANTSEQ